MFFVSGILSLVAFGVPRSFGFDSPASRLKGSEWPLYQGGPGFAGVSPDKTVKPPFKLVWSYRMDGDASGDAGGGVTVAGGLVYVNVLNTRSLLAIDAVSGRLRWTYDKTYLGYRTVPSYANGRLFLWERGRKSKPGVMALDAATGRVLWRVALRPDHLLNVRAGLPVAGGRVFATEGGEEPRVTALDEKTGKPVWRAGLGKEHGNEIGPASVSGGFVFVASRTALSRRRKPGPQVGAVVALDAATGKELWRHRAVRPGLRPLYTDGKVVAATFYEKTTRKYLFRLLSAKNGKVLWTFDRRFSRYNPPAATIGKDVVLIKPYGGSFYVVDRGTGRQIARFRDRTNSGCGTPVLAGGHAYLGTGVFAGDLEAIKSFQLVNAPRETGRCASLHAVDIKTGKSSWFCGTGNTVCGDPAIAYGRLYFTSRDGRVYCYAPAKPDEIAASKPVNRVKATDSESVATLLAAKPRKLFTPAATWPMAGGNPARSGVKRPRMRLPLKPVWKFRLGDRILGSAAIAGDKVFVGSNAGKLVAIAARNGKSVWEFDTGGPIRCAPAVGGDLVYCGSDSGTFHAIAADSGKLVWRFRCGGPIRAAPAVVGNVVLFAADDRRTYALNRLTGKLLWSFRLRGRFVQAAPAVLGRQVFVGQWNDWVYALDVRTGKQQWRTFIPISIESLACYRGKLYVRAPNYLVEIDPKTGKRMRLCRIPYGYGGVAFLGSRVFQSGVRSQYGGPGLEIVDLSQPGTKPRRKIPTLDDARILRAKPMKGASELAAMTTPLVLGDTLCFATLKGKLLIVKPGGERLWSTTLGGACHSSPVAAGGLLVVGCDDGFVYAFRGRD